MDNEYKYFKIIGFPCGYTSYYKINRKGCGYVFRIGKNDIDKSNFEVVTRFAMDFIYRRTVMIQEQEYNIINEL